MHILQQFQRELIRDAYEVQVHTVLHAKDLTIWESAFRPTCTKSWRKSKRAVNANQTQTNYPIWLFNIMCSLKKQVILWVTETQLFYFKKCVLCTIYWGMKEAPYFVLNILSRHATKVLSRPGTSPLVCNALHGKYMKPKWRKKQTTLKYFSFLKS